MSLKFKTGMTSPYHVVPQHCKRTYCSNLPLDCPCPHKNKFDGNPKLDCNDLLTAVTQAVVDLANPNGATKFDIVEQMLVLCPQASESDAEKAVDNSAALGILAYKRNKSGVCRYYLNANMCGVNPKTQKYLRKFCEMWKG